MLTNENRLRSEGHKLIAGLDEVGRGCLAGPVVAACVILPETVDLPDVTDSKAVPKTKHHEIVEKILSQASYVGVGVIHNDEIDATDILKCTKLAMLKAIEQTGVTPDYLLIDGGKAQKLKTDIPQETIVKGDSQSLSIAAASLVAKVIRDDIMKELAKTYPGYGFENNAGYGTPAHIKAIHEIGITPIHRKSFKPISELI